MHSPFFKASSALNISLKISGETVLVR